MRREKRDMVEEGDNKGWTEEEGEVGKRGGGRQERRGRRGKGVSRL